ncbi:20S-pre-rRNA D-site endonuclease nob1 [Microsporum canis]
MAEQVDTSDPAKPVHTIILDAGPLIKNVPPVSTLLSQSHALITTPSVVSEIRDPEARRRIETLYLPFLTQRTPKPDSLRVVSEFARKTGDREVLSKNDLEILALAYEVECERNCGDWRLRRVPGQKGINGSPPAHLMAASDANQDAEKQTGGNDDKQEGISEEKLEKVTEVEVEGSAGEQRQDDAVEEVTQKIEDTTLEQIPEDATNEPATEPADLPSGDAEVYDSNGSGESNEYDEGQNSAPIDESDSDPDGWITPSNLKKQQVRDAAIGTAAQETKTMQVATITGDFAMQNVLLQMNLNILSPSNMQRIRQVKSYIMRCHGCFMVTRDMSKQFCPRCGQPTLNRVSCSTSAKGEFRMHLKKNMQWNNRGNKYSIPKPIAGTANTKWSGIGGGKGGWGMGLILAEDQKEHTRAVTEEERRKKKGRDLMDDDYLPSILSGDRQRAGGRIKVGAGRNVNSRKRR